MKFRSLIVGAVLAIAPGIQAQTPVPALADSTSTALAVFIGSIINNNLADHEAMGFDIDRRAFVSELADYLNGEKPTMDAAEAKEFLNGLYAKVQPEPAPILPPADSIAEAAFLAAAASRPGALVLPSGTVLETLAAGSGPAPTLDGIVEMRYLGTLSDGSVFDEIAETEAPIDFPVAALSEGMMEALLNGIRAGGTYRVTVPASAAYGNEGVPGRIPPGATLQFVMTIIDAE